VEVEEVLELGGLVSAEVTEVGVGSVVVPDGRVLEREKLDLESVAEEVAGVWVVVDFSSVSYTTVISDSNLASLPSLQEWTPTTDSTQY
jgi:hypothetical protein